MAGEAVPSTESLQHTIDAVFAGTSIQTQPERVRAATLTTHLPGFRVLDTKMLPPDVAAYLSEVTESGRPVVVDNDPDTLGDRGRQRLPSRLIGRLLTSSATGPAAQIPDEGDALHIQCKTVKAHVRRYGDIIPLGKDLPQLSVMAAQWFYTGQLILDEGEVELNDKAKATSITLRYPLYDNSKTDLTVVQTLYPYDSEIETASVKHIGEYWEGVPMRPFGGMYVTPENMMQTAFAALAVAGTEYQVRDMRRFLP